jgi:hypothetical protein
MTIGEKIDQTGPVIDRLNAAIRENPLAAGLITAGVAWMLFGGAKGLGAFATSAATQTATRTGAAASAAVGVVTDGLTEAGSKAAVAMKEAASDIVGSVASIVPNMSLREGNSGVEAGSDTSTVSERFKSTVAKGPQYGNAIQSRFSESLERQPLLVGVIGLAIGAGIASAFASTTVESEWMGERAAAAREQLQGIAGDLKDRAGKIMSDVKDEAGRQGLTTERAKDAAIEIGEKFKTAAGAGRDSVTQRFSK